MFIVSYNRGCCTTPNYTTRKYDLSGNTLWRSDYFQGMPSSYPADFTARLTGAVTGTYSNGSSGVGATITATSNGLLSMDSATVATNDILLLKTQANLAQNGLYVVTDPGSGSTPFILTRLTTFDQASEILLGTIVRVTAGTVNHDTSWVMNQTAAITVGTTDVTWVDATLLGYQGKIVSTQAVDSNYVYVGGSRCTSKAFHQWSLVCFDKTTGAKVWDYDTGSDVRKVLIDPNGNIVCMNDPGSGNYTLSIGTATGTLYTQSFTVVDTTGALVQNVSFTQVRSPGGGVKSAVRTIDFCINEDGDYHILGAMACNFSAVNPWQYTQIYEWLSPQSGSPSLVEFADLSVYCTSINRIGGRDYIGSDATLLSPGFGLTSSSLKRGKAQQAAPASTADFDFRVPDCFYDNSIFPLTNVATIAAAGTTQATAAVLTANRNYQAMTTSIGNQGFRLPDGVAGDAIGLDRAVSGSSIASAFVYPPIGGLLNYDPTIARVATCKGDVFVCIAPKHWVEIHNSITSDANFNTLFYWNVQALAIDSANRHRIVRAKSSQRETVLDASNLPAFVRALKNNIYYPQWLCLDGSDNSYTLGKRTSAGVSLIKRDSAGAFQWGHLHSGTSSIIDSLGIYQPLSGYTPIQYDSTDNTIVASGFDDSNGIFGPNFTVNDQNFVTDPDGPVISIGRTAFLRTTGAGTNQSLAFSGSPPVSGTQILFISSAGTGATDGIPSGGTTWTSLVSDQAPTSRIYTHVCGGSEPASYTVSYSGAGKGDAIQCIMIEILNANSGAPTPTNYYREADNGGTPTTTNTTVASSNYNSAAIVACAHILNTDPGATQVMLPPSGYTMAKYYAQDISNGLWGVAIAYKTVVGLGSIAPGNFTDQGSGTADFMQLTATALYGP